MRFEINDNAQDSAAISIVIWFSVYPEHLIMMSIMAEMPMWAF